MRWTLTETVTGQRDGQTYHAAMAKPIDGIEVQGMVSHWLSTPPNGYLGSGYGSNVGDLPMTPLAGGTVDEVIAKLKDDVPILRRLPGAEVDIYAVAEKPDIMRLYISVAGDLVAIDAQGINRAN